jgi:hypothetical protein
MDDESAAFLLSQAQSMLKIVEKKLAKKYMKGQALLDQLKSTLSQPPSEAILKDATIKLMRLEICKSAIEMLQKLELELLEEAILYTKMMRG